ncbi:MAG TPA: hypothetical protein VJU86_10850 [Pyrinomonadaceae bacterium]|nr:hypothetical protein [Pyrinomonadaceae bacterium]
MAKKQTTKARTRTKELPRKEKKLTNSTLKKVKGGAEVPQDQISLNYSKITYRSK